jgi:hypothetical protein
MVIVLRDGRWRDITDAHWFAVSGHPVPRPTPAELGDTDKVWEVRLAAAHLDHHWANDDDANLASLCQVCHLTHDRPYHRIQRRLTWLERRALGDLFDGMYAQMRDGATSAARPYPHNR